MLIEERQSRLQTLLAQRGISDLESLSTELRVSQSTVRRDLDAMESHGLVRRTHGGVIWIGDRNNSKRPYAFDQRMAVQVDSKRAIARAAAKLVRDGQTILLDGGTTTFHLAQELLGRSMQIVTNSLPIANLFINEERIELILTGGLLYPRYGVLLGPSAEQFIDSVHAQTLFFSVAGIHRGILYNQNLLLVQSEQRMMRQAQRRVLLCDSSKFDQQALAQLCELKQIDTLVIDGRITKEQRAMAKQAGCEVLVAS
ncbi:MAG: DeoR/GlpR transcriptional regulator [Anaerolineae bacterium]|nr:DeoR/GlpR transcriptional regulator [Phycisphaerae bacterium]